MKFKHLVSIILLSIGLSACNKNIDYSGNYYSVDGKKIYYSFQKLTDNEYDLKLHLESGTYDKGTVTVKDNNVLRVIDKLYRGKFDGDNKFIADGGYVYTKSK